MKIGLFHLYPFRPHVKTLAYLSSELKDLGHNVKSFGCFNRVKNCYYKKINDDSIFTCIKCNLNQIGLFEESSVYRGKVKQDYDISNLEGAINSVIATSHRFETAKQVQDYKDNNPKIVDQYKFDLKVTMASFEHFIKLNEIEFVIGFNGRMDHTAACFEVCRVLGIPFISYETGDFGAGLRMIANNDCLDLNVWKYANSKFSNYALSVEQALKVYGYVKGRFQKTIKHEWREYSDYKRAKLDKPPKVLVLPSSRSEFEGHKQHISSWGHSTLGFSKVIEELGVDPNDVVVQFHPIWYQKIYGKAGHEIVKIYQDWCNIKGYRSLTSDNILDSKGLIEQAEFILINGSSAAFEAGIIGKKIINVEPTRYAEAGITIDILNEMDLKGLQTRLNSFDANEIQLKTYRFFYTVMFRLVQAEDLIKASTVSNYNYQKGINLKQMIDSAIKGQPIINDDSIENGNATFERMLIDNILTTKIITSGESFENDTWIEKFRNAFPKGDQK